MLNGRKQVLLQDEADVPTQGIQWCAFVLLVEVLGEH